jgi:hypothetical protein
VVQGEGAEDDRVGNGQVAEAVLGVQTPRAAREDAKVLEVGCGACKHAGTLGAGLADDVEDVTMVEEPGATLDTMLELIESEPVPGEAWKLAARGYELDWMRAASPCD